ncbi:InlB B-repeat-containing protein [Marinilabiliaceae bacterium ANBcel2]|nr:InlB B-repeat-containing protein [Marinilabiliaceae bacterium ANBcel2]
MSVLGDIVRMAYSRDGFFALYNAVTHTITFNNNGGDTEADPASIDVEYGSTIEAMPAEPKKEGHTFVEWNSDSNGEGEPLTLNSIITFDVTVYAIWQEIPTHIVEFDVAEGEGSIHATIDGETISDGQLIYEGSEIVFTATPEEGYQISEWTLNEEVIDGYTESTYTVENLSENIDITVGFELATHIVKNRSKGVVLFPNPASNYLFIEADKRIVEVELYNINGQAVVQKKIDNSNGRLKVANYAQGVYLLIINFESNSITKRVNIKN